jgi:hypothetical protein
MALSRWRAQSGASFSRKAALDEPIRVLVMEMRQQMQQQMVLNGVRAAGMTPLTARADIDERQLSELAPDVVVVESEDPRAAALPFLRLGLHPLRVVSLTPDSRVAALTELCTRTVLIGNQEMHVLIDTIRSVARSGLTEC